MTVKQETLLLSPADIHATCNTYNAFENSEDNFLFLPISGLEHSAVTFLANTNTQPICCTDHRYRPP